MEEGKEKEKEKENQCSLNSFLGFVVVPESKLKNQTQLC